MREGAGVLSVYTFRIMPLFSFALNVFRLLKLTAGWPEARHSWGVITSVIYRPLLTLELRVSRKMQDVRITPSPGGLKY